MTLIQASLFFFPLPLGFSPALFLACIGDAVLKASCLQAFLGLLGRADLGGPESGISL